MPVAEAMATGCAVIGYSGLGGRELFIESSLYDCISFEVSYGDYMSFLRFAEIISSKINNSPLTYLDTLTSNALRIKSLYSLESMTADIMSAISLLDS